MYRRLGALVEPFRDDLAAPASGRALRPTRAAGRPDDGAVARLTHQVEIVRDTYAGLLMVTRGFLFSAGAALLGLLALAPVVAALAVDARWSPVWSCSSPRCRRWSRTSAPTSGPGSSSARRRRPRWPVTATCSPAAHRYA